jgi:glucosylceramidase
MFWALAHFSKFVKRGARRIESQGTSDSLFHCAFENPGGSLTVVIINRGPACACEIALDARMARVSLTANSVATVTASRSAVFS